MHFEDSMYRKDIEHLYHAFMYSPVSILCGIYPLPAMHSLLVTSDDRNVIIDPDLDVLISPTKVCS